MEVNEKYKGERVFQKQKWLKESMKLKAVA